jgi:HAD superfamily hydrolase (TIGR01509 family)
MTNAARSIDWVLFDWGNVLVEYRPLGRAKLAARIGVELELLSRFLTASRWLQALTVGDLAPAVALEQLGRQFDVQLTRAEVVECFRSDIEHELPGIRPLLAELQGSYRLAILSNTFFGHWDAFEGSELYRMFELPIASHLLGAAKPSREAFEAALQRMGTTPERVVFIDDNADNVAVAQGIGIHALVTDSVATTRTGLAALLPSLRTVDCALGSASDRGV